MTEGETKFNFSCTNAACDLSPKSLNSVRSTFEAWHLMGFRCLQSLGKSDGTRSTSAKGPQIRTEAWGIHTGEGVSRPNGHLELSWMNDVAELVQLGLHLKALFQTECHAG